MVVLILFAAAGAGAAAALGGCGWLWVPVDAVVFSLADLAAKTVDGLLTAFAVPGGAAQLAGALAGLMLPGLVCLLLAEAAQASVTLRRAAGCILVLGGCGSFLFLPTGAALGLAGLAVAAAALMSVAARAAVTGPVAAAAGFFGARLTLLAVPGRLPQLHRAAHLLAGHLPLGGAWPPVLAGLALLPVAAAAVRVVRGTGR